MEILEISSKLFKDVGGTLPVIFDNIPLELRLGKLTLVTSTFQNREVRNLLMADDIFMLGYCNEKDYASLSIYSNGDLTTTARFIKTDNLKLETYYEPRFKTKEERDHEDAMQADLAELDRLDRTHKKY